MKTSGCWLPRNHGDEVPRVLDSFVEEQRECTFRQELSPRSNFRARAYHGHPTCAPARRESCRISSRSSFCSLSMMILACVFRRRLQSRSSVRIRRFVVLGERKFGRVMGVPYFPAGDDCSLLDRDHPTCAPARRESYRKSIRSILSASYLLSKCDLVLLNLFYELVSEAQFMHGFGEIVDLAFFQTHWLAADNAQNGSEAVFHITPKSSPRLSACAAWHIERLAGILANLVYNPQW